MEPTKSPIEELLARLESQRDAEALYEAFTAALEKIPYQDVKTEVCMNTVRYIATQNATARVQNKKSVEELAGLFEEECKRLSNNMLAMPDQFREYLSKRGEPARNTVVEVLLGALCECERCRGFRAAVQASEAPTEIPPPPDVTH